MCPSQPGSPLKTPFEASLCSTPAFLVLLFQGVLEGLSELEAPVLLFALLDVNYEDLLWAVQSLGGTGGGPCSLLICLTWIPRTANN